MKFFWHKGSHYKWWMRFRKAEVVNTSGCFDDECGEDVWQIPGWPDKYPDGFLSTFGSCKCNNFAAKQKQLAADGFIPVAFTAGTGTLWYQPESGRLVQVYHSFGR